MRLAALMMATATALSLSLSGCEVFKGREETQVAIGSRVVGMPAGDFFDRYGRAKSRVEISNNTVEYGWESAVGYAPPGITGLDERTCKLRLVADSKGRIAEVSVLFDAPGRTSTSRCREIFAAP